MSAAKALIQGFVSRLLPGAFIDDRDDAKPVRMKRYGEINISEADGSLYGYSDEGSVLVATNATIGTGLTGVTAQIVFNDTGPALYIYNSENAANPNAKSLYLGYLKMIATAAATTSTSQHYAGVLDTVYRTITTDNYATIVPVNPNGATAVGATPIVKFQNNATVSLIAASSVAKRIVCRGTLGGLNIVGDEMIISFGRGDISPHPGLTAVQAAGVSKRVSNAPPVIIGPGQTFTLHLWGLAQAAAYSPEIELVMWAR